MLRTICLLPLKVWITLVTFWMRTALQYQVDRWASNCFKNFKAKLLTVHCQIKISLSRSIRFCSISLQSAIQPPLQFSMTHISKGNKLLPTRILWLRPSKFLNRLSRSSQTNLRYFDFQMALRLRTKPNGHQVPSQTLTSQNWMVRWPSQSRRAKAKYLLVLLLHRQLCWRMSITKNSVLILCKLRKTSSPRIYGSHFRSWKTPQCLTNLLKLRISLLWKFHFSKVENRRSPWLMGMLYFSTNRSLINWSKKPISFQSNS